MAWIVLGSLLLGIVSGLRTFLALAVLYLARGGVAGYVLALVAAGEFVGDLLPATPSRTTLPQMLARLASGGFVGWMLCAFLGAPPLAGAASGVLGALAGTYGGAAARAALARRIGPIPAALGEDLAGIALAVAVVLWLGPLRAA